MFSFILFIAIYMFGIYNDITLHVYGKAYQHLTLHISIWAYVILASAFHRHGSRYVSDKYLILLAPH